jgi:hypothetical protein
MLRSVQNARLDQLFCQSCPTICSLADNGNTLDHQKKIRGQFIKHTQTFSLEIAKGIEGISGKYFALILTSAGACKLHHRWLLPGSTLLVCMRLQRCYSFGDVTRAIFIIAAQSA